MWVLSITGALTLILRLVFPEHGGQLVVRGGAKLIVLLEFQLVALG